LSVAAATPLYQQAGTQIAFWLLFGLFALGEAAMRFRSRFVNTGGTRAERWTLVAVVAGVIGGLLGGLAAAQWQAGQVTVARWPLFITGLVLMAAGVFIRQWSIFTLGRFFTADVRLRPGQTVVERGPYRWVRHPSYSGLVLFFIGMGLALGNYLALAVLAIVPVAGLIPRIHAEERVLLEGLGDPYRQFAASRSRLFPWIW